MDISGPQFVSSAQRPEMPAQLNLQVNQRIAAAVLQIAGDQVTLALEGIPFVARLTNSEQAALLTEQRVAHFIVRDNTGTAVLLQLLTADSEAVPPEAPKQFANLIPNLLRMASLPVDEANFVLAQALLKQNLPVTAELVNELRSAMPKQVTQSEANLAAMLKAAGLPVTAETLALALSQDRLPSLAELVNRLKSRLEEVNTSRMPPQLAEEVKSALDLLKKLSVNWNSSASELAERVRQTFAALGRPLERELAEVVQSKMGITLSAQEGAALSQLLASLGPRLLMPTSAEGYVTLVSELVRLIQADLERLNSNEGQIALARQLAQLIQQKSGGNLTGEEMATLEKGLLKWLQYQIGSAKYLQESPSAWAQTKATLATLIGGQELESELAKFLQNKLNIPQEGSIERSWLMLARLRHDLAGKVPTALLDDIDRLLDHARWLQFRNVEPQTPPAKGQWLSMDLPMIVPNQQGNPEQAVVQLRIAYQSEGKSHKIDPDHTHLVLHFDLDDEESIDVDLAIVARKIGAHVIVSSPDLYPIAEEELAGLQDGLQELGYSLQASRCEISRAHIRTSERSVIEEMARLSSGAGLTNHLDVEV